MKVEEVELEKKGFVKIQENKNHAYYLLEKDFLEFLIEQDITTKQITGIQIKSTKDLKEYIDYLINK
ncbi:MAG: hypothetical protein QXU20_03830 [Candidatus Woesearchaeota archaeon]